MRLFFGVMLVWLVLSIAAYGETFTLKAGGADSVVFRSTAKLEFIEGRTAAIEGSFNYDRNHPTSVSGILRVDLRTLQTGIEMRDEHMRDRHLETEKYPYAYFELTSISGLDSLVDGKPDSGTALGWFYIHGCKREIVARMKVTAESLSDGRQLSIHASFQLNLDEYGIPRPKALFLKLAETIEIECIFSGYNNLPAVDISLPAWEESSK